MGLFGKAPLIRHWLEGAYLGSKAARSKANMMPLKAFIIRADYNLIPRKYTVNDSENVSNSHLIKNTTASGCESLLLRGAPLILVISFNLSWQ